MIPGQNDKAASTVLFHTQTHMALSLVMLGRCLFLLLAGAVDAAKVLSVFKHEKPSALEQRKIQQAFDATLAHFEKTFDYATYNASISQLEAAKNSYKEYARTSVSPHCDKGSSNPSTAAVSHVTHMSAFPGGAMKSLFGSDLTKKAYDLSIGISSPAATGIVPAMALAQQGLMMGAGLVQSIVAAAVHIVPPLIPPPVWNNQPLTCAPMVTGHNCFGAVLYPITMADFVIADVTDSMLDGVISGFPNTYAASLEHQALLLIAALCCAT